MHYEVRFCPHCATELQPITLAEDGGDKERLRCPACGWTHWNNPTPVLAAIVEIDGKVLLAADGKLPLQDVKDLLSGGYNAGIARCKNPFRENESVCKKFFACFKCPSMCVFEDDLWRLFSFYYRLLAERAKINPIHWLKTYSPILRRIDAEIASQFPADKVEAARLKAQQTPHPAWKGPLL